MNDENRPPQLNVRTLTALTELIEALDRRVPRVERLGERRIASEAEALRKAALRRAKQLHAASAESDVREADFADAVIG